MILQLFPTQIYYDSLYTSAAKTKQTLKDLRGDIKKIHNSDEEGQRWSKRNYLGGYTSFASWDRLHQMSPYFGELEVAINSHVRKYSHKLELDIPARELQMTSCWVNIMPAQVVHTMHIHPLSVISGTFYVTIPRGASPLKFEDPRHECFMGSPPRKAEAHPRNQRFYQLQPKEGHVVLFESWQRHEVPANPAAGERISVSFNYDWIRR